MSRDDCLVERALQAVQSETARVHKHEHAVSGVSYFLLGLLVCFFGRRLCRFVCGLVVAGFACVAVANETSITDCKVLTGAVGIVGCVSFIVSVVLFKTGIFVVGAAAGGLAAYVLFINLPLLDYDPIGVTLFGSPLLFFWLAVSAASIISGAVAVRKRNPVLVAATSLLGSLLAASGVARFKFAFDTRFASVVTAVSLGVLGNVFQSFEKSSK